MNGESFELLARARSEGPGAVFDALIRHAREEKDYRLLFGARQMQARHAFRLPLIETETAELPAEIRPAYEKNIIEAAREAGSLFLADGDIVSAWPYFRAIGERAPVTAAIEAAQSGEGIERVIQIALEEGVNPRKGFELILEQHGICRAISIFSGYRDMPTRPACLELLVRTLYRELLASLRETVTATEGPQPVDATVASLIAGRDWLFEGTSYYVDSTHLASILRFAPELEDVAALRMAAEMADYGRPLAPMFHFRDDPPFENTYEDFSIYLHALLGEDVEAAIAHFETKVSESDPAQRDTTPAEVLVEFLVRLNRYPAAIEASLKHLRGVEAGRLSCPSLIQLCQMAGDYARLAVLARDEGDLLSFTAGLIETSVIEAKQPW